MIFREFAGRLKLISRLTLLIVISGLLLSCSSEEPQQAKPNILFVFTDDHAPHAIGAYGSRINETPNMDRLAKEGMIFHNAFVTNSICAPSRAVILTGKHSHLNGILTNRERFDGTQLTFPKLLQANGYQTAIIGKWHLKTEPTGFDYWEVLPGQGNYYNPDFRTQEGTVTYTGYVTDIITEKVLGWLDNGRDQNKPFMLMYQHKAPHREWAPGPNHLTLYDDLQIPEPETLFDDWQGRTSAAQTQEMTIARHMRLYYDLKVLPTEEEAKEGLGETALRLYNRMNDSQKKAWDQAYVPRNEAFRSAGLEGDELIRWKYQRYIKDYLRTIAAVDDNLGRVLDYLDANGLAEDTIVIYSSDQGFYLGDHGWFDKRWMYEESLRMPLIVRWPGVVSPGSENNDLVQNLDFAETFLDAAGAVIPPEMQGHSLLPLLRGEKPSDWRDSIYYQYYEYPGAHSVAKHYGIRTRDHKLIYYYEIDEWELFDLEKDPDEMNSMYSDPEYSSVVSDLKEQLQQLREQYEVPEKDPTSK